MRAVARAVVALLPRYFNVCLLKRCPSQSLPLHLAVPCSLGQKGALPSWLAAEIVLFTSENEGLCRCMSN